MGKRITRIALGVLGLLLALVVLFAVASESGEVVVLRTGAGEDLLETRLWVVDADGAMLLRGSEGKAWVAGLRADPDAELQRSGEWKPVYAIEEPAPELRDRVNQLMLDKYRLSERLIGLVRDVDTSVIFRLAASR